MQMRTVQYFSRAGDRNDNDVTSPRMKGNIPVRSATFEEPSGKVGRLVFIGPRRSCFVLSPILMAPDAFNSEAYEQTHSAAGSSVYQAR